MKTVISLCDLTGNMVFPWVQNGYSALLVDPQHGTTRTITTDMGNTVTKCADTIQGARDLIEHIIATQTVVMVLGAPPCTHLALSGARWFKRKQEDPTYEHYQGPDMFSNAMDIVHDCAMIGKLADAPFMIENPKSRISTLWRKPDHIMQPWHYTGYAPEDNYKKETWLWTGGGFKMPEPFIDESLESPDDRIHKAAPGPERANMRSAAPMGFAKAVYQANGI